MTLSLRFANVTQGAPGGLHEEAALMIARASSTMLDAFDALFEPYGITATQYNVLRILRGAGTSGLCRNDVISRMVTRMPDVTRLIDRLETAGHVTRARDSLDKRHVTMRLTPAGAKLLTRLDPVVASTHRRRLGHLTTAQLKSLIRLLQLARAGQ